MIFKKIYTFLNDYFNGKKISKVFSTLIFTLIFSSALFFTTNIVEVSAQERVNEDGDPIDEDGEIKHELLELKLNAQSKASSDKILKDMQSTPRVLYKNNNDGVSASLTNEFYINYEKDGLPPNKIYTSYLPPKNTYNKDLATEHSRGFCRSMGKSGLKMIGRDCMIKIPFDCNRSEGNFPALIDSDRGVNCLIYSDVFHDTSTGKKLNPKKCENGLVDGENCLSTQKDYCHETNNPILGINCKLAPCNFIPNQQYRRPGVNCLADCNDAPGEHISQARFFMEGFNCLSSCKTAPTEPKKEIGEHCVLEFNKYVMPLCSDYRGVTNSKHFNTTTRKNKRESCLDVEDLPICTGYSGESELKNCVRECSGGVTDPRHNVNCVNFNSDHKQLYYGVFEKECHKYTDQGSLNANSGCKKIDCHRLSDSELAKSLNVFGQNNGKSSAKYCDPTVYTNFSNAQFIAINSRRPPNFLEPYLTDYLLDYKPCYSRGDTQEIETILSSAFYGSTTSKITSLIQRADSAYANTGIESLTDKDFFYYDPSLTCPLDNISQSIDCKVYLRDTLHRPPYDCNSPSFCKDCCQNEECSEPTICGPGDEFCYKNGINCNNEVNKAYTACAPRKRDDDSKSTDKEDEYVSWFFRPTVPEDAIKKSDVDGKNYLVKMKGYPTETMFRDDGKGDIYMDQDDMDKNGYGKYASFLGFFALRTTIPPSVGTNLGIPGIGAGNLCGMNGDYRGTPNDDVGYFKGEVKTTYEDSKASHEVEVCLRYVSGSTPGGGSCGHRECRTTCAFGYCTKLCGLDVCRKLIIEEGSDQKCELPRYNFENWNTAKCISTFDTKLDAISRQTRVRIYKPDKSSNYICAVLEFHGITTRHLSTPFFNGTEFFEVPDPKDIYKTKKICVSGTFIESSQSCVEGVDSNSDNFNTNLWRTSKIIKYIMAPKTDYIDQYGVGPADLSSKHIDFKTGKEVNQTMGRVKFNIKRYFETSDCIRHQERIPAPIFHSIATPSDSEKLFLPSIEIVDKCRIAISGSTNCDAVDETDFFKPAITIKYGHIVFPNSNLSADLNSLNTNYKIIKIEDATKNVSGDYVIKLANIEVSGIDVSQKVFIRKESFGSKPILCLYRKIPLESDPTQYKEEVIKCVNRKRATRAAITPPLSPPHVNRIFNAGFLKDEGDSHASITETLSTEKFEFLDLKGAINNKEYLKVCVEISAQGFPICIQRDECSLLNNECVENEKALIDSKNSSDLELGTIQQLELVSDYCKKELLVKCNLRKGYKLTASNQTLNTSIVEDVGFNAPNHPDYHGWFNEFCIVNGIEKLDDSNKKVYVQRNINENGQLGSCIKDLNCATCNDDRCLRASCCIILKSGSIGDPSEATPHELGLCYELTNYLPSCPALSYGKNSDISDPFYMGESFLNNINLYQGNGITPKAGVIFTKGHQSHLDRFNSMILSYDTNNAEYEVAYAGTKSLKGKCVGFYKNRIPANYPTANCNSDGVWEDFAENVCNMYACPAKITLGANSFGKYSADYDSVNAREGSARGFIDGYANWDSLQKTKLFKESSTATSCIVGHAKSGATKNLNPISLGEVSDQTLLTNLNNYKSKLTSVEENMATQPTLKDRTIYRAINSLFGKYTGFSGGTSPTRYCNQRGAWEDVSNACERITCPPILFDETAEAGSFYLNDYDLIITTEGVGKIIYSQNSPYQPSASPTKAKFIITSSVSSTTLTNPVYLSATNQYNSFLIKDKGLPASITINKTYVAQLITPSSGSKYWEIIDNANDGVLNLLWQKSGGASFSNTGYALRSNMVDYITSDPNDPNSPGDPRDQHRVTGVCNENMRFKSLGFPPQLTCDSNGNWVNLINPCISDCKAISNTTIASNANHGFATWEESSAVVGQSKVEESMKPGPPPRGGCVYGYQPYPYTPLFDNEGTKKDFGIGALGVNNAIDTVFMTSDSYNAIAIASDGATFEARAGVGENLASSDSNNNGIYYNLKIQTSNSQSQSIASATPQESVQDLFYLFSTDAPLTMSAPNQNVWSKISFSSFGTPKYSSTENIAEDPACRSPYSKLIFANKCIGKTSCSIGLPDFTSYDPSTVSPLPPSNTCTKTNLGNGENGQQNVTVDSYGSGGGGGGGNNPGNGGSPTGSININGTSGSSFYDQSFHLERPSLSDSENKGLKVNLKVVDTGNALFKGKDGSVTIIESTTQGFSSIARTANYTTPGVHDHTVTTGSTNQDIYIKYEMSGAGGGGGGQGLTPGTDGASGSKMMGGIFKVKRGDVLKIYVGGGGGAGKTKCRSSQGAFLDPKITQPAIEIIEPTKKTNLAIKMLENYQLNLDQIITHNTKIIDRDSSIKSPLAKIFSKISDIFISEGYAEVLICGDKANGYSSSSACTNWDTGNYNTSCSCPRVGEFGVRAHWSINQSGSINDFMAEQDYTSLGGWKDNISSISFPWGNTRARFKCHPDSDWTGWFYSGNANLGGYSCRDWKWNWGWYEYDASLHDNIDQIQVEYYRDCGLSYSNNCNCNANRHWNDSSCTNNSCSIPLATGYDAQTGSASGPVNCGTGFTGTVTYTCPTNNGNATVTGTCTAITCTASGKGFADKTGLAYSNTGNLQTIACGGTGYLAYTGNINYTCSTTGAATNIGTCGCATGYARIGTSLDCTAITCTASGKGFADKTGLAYSNTGNLQTIACGGAGYLAYATGNINYTCSTTGAATNIGTCGCASGYARIGTSLDCTAIACRISGTGYTDRDVSGVGEVACDAGYYGKVNYTCTGAKTAATPAGTSIINSESCTRIKCNLPVEAYSNIPPVNTISIAEYREVDYAPTSTVYECSYPGYRKTYNATYQEIDPTYTCVGNSDQSAQRNPSTVAYKDACVKRTCFDLGGVTYQFNDGKIQTFPCSNVDGFWGNSKLICNIGGIIEWKEICQPIKCLIPDGTIAGQVAKNTTRDGRWVNFSASEVGLDCKPGYYYEQQTRPKYICSYKDDENLPNRGVLTFVGLPCQRITCQIPATGSPLSLNSIIDGTSVNWNGNGSDYVATTCKGGFYQSSADSPSYSCSGANRIGELRTINPCPPVTCDLAESFGMLAKTNLEYGTNRTTSCDKSGYSGTVEYNCVNPVNVGKGVATIVSSTCAESSCVASGNNFDTFTNYVTSAVTLDGAGGKISSSIGFLNGGNGGSATTASRTSGSGGGGGSASMITINKRIIAIAGGGGGGAGGGENENTSNALAKVSNFDNLDIRLNSNVFGPYFIGKMEYTPINIDADKTTGIIYNKITSPATELSLNAPSGTFINDVLLASYGSPTVNFASSSSLVLKHGGCNDQTSLTKSINQCVGKTSCLIDTSTLFPSCQSLASKEFGLVASYYFKEPTLQVFGSAGPYAYKMKEMSNNQVTPATNLINGTVYTFLFKISENLWFKYPYLADEYLISETVTSNKIRIKFHRTNTTFSPKLKTNQGSLPIKKLDEDGGTTSLSVGYISTDKVYILTNDSGNWIIREYTNQEVSSALPVAQREHPKRSCMTTKISSAGAVNVSWSLPNSSCVNYCPGYDRVTGIGDDRIGVGATRHLTSKGPGIVYWKKGTLNQVSIMKFSNTKDANDVFPEVTSAIPTSHFRNGQARQYFVLSRKCNADGSWSDPVPLCAYNSVSDTNADGVPVDPDIGTSYITSGETNQEYITSNSSEYVESLCRSGYFGQTNDQYWYPGVFTYPAPKYNCMKTTNNVDEVYFNQMDNGNQRRPCARYCPDVSSIYASKSSITGKSNYKVRYNGDFLANDPDRSNGQITLECNEGYLSRSGLKPIATCIKDGDGRGTVRWSTEIFNDCTEARDCRFASLASNDGILAGEYWFPLSKFIAKQHRDNGMKHRKIYTYSVNALNSVVGNCGYCKYKSDWVAGISHKHRYFRKFLKSYSCNDGVWNSDWENSESEAKYRLACDDDEWDYTSSGIGDWGGDWHRTNQFLGDCKLSKTEKSDTSSFNNITFWDGVAGAGTETSF